LLDGVPDGDSVIFTPTGAFPKDEGLFSSEDYFVFKSAYQLKADRTYRITIRNSETGFEMKAQTGLLGNRPLAYSYAETRYYNINQYQPEDIEYDGSLITSQFEKRIIRLLYYEYEGDARVMKYCDWRSPYTKSQEDGRQDQAPVRRDHEVLRPVAEQVGGKGIDGVGVGAHAPGPRQRGGLADRAGDVERAQDRERHRRDRGTPQPWAARREDAGEGDGPAGEQPERPSQGTEVGTPGKAVRPTGRTCSYGWEGQLAVRVGRLGRPQSPTKGSTARKQRRR